MNNRAPKNSIVHLPALLLACMSFGLFGCFQGSYSEKPPIHIVPNMDTQPKYRALRASEFFENGSAMRPLVPGTIARGHLNEDIPYYTGRVAGDTTFVKTSPVPLTLELLQRGQERFNIYCAPCHGRAGDGRGIIVQRNSGMLPPTDYHSQRLREMPDGQIYDAIYSGIRNMPSYRTQIPVSDRWAIVAYVRALQLSQNAPAALVPENVRGTLK